MYKTPRWRINQFRWLGLRRFELIILVVILTLSSLLLRAAYVHYAHQAAASGPIQSLLSAPLVLPPLGAPGAPVSNLVGENPPLTHDALLAKRDHYASHAKPFEHRIMPAKKAEELALEKASVPEGVFLPGSLPMLGLSRGDVLGKCYLARDSKIPGGQGCTISRKHKIIYHMTPKSGSSTGRHVIKNDFDGVDYTSGCIVPRNEDPKAWMQIATLRNPASRAFASYEEMFVRRLGMLEHIPVHARAFMEPFKGFLYPNYSAMFDKPEGVAKLTRAYEQFMRDWDGQNVFDMHLERQVLYNVKRDANYGRPTSRHLTLVFDTHKMQEAFEWLAIQKNLDHVPKVIRGRAYPRRLNVSDVNDEAMHAMCRFYAIDFCCLNYELPPACLRAPVGKRVRCQWRKEDGEDWIETVIV